jgi:uncharacterized metal-binding protein
MSEKGKVVVVACAGMDKPLGSVTSASVFKVMEELRPQKVELVSIPPLMAGVSTQSSLIKNLQVITVDGCAERCATKLVVKSGGKIRGRIFVPDSAKKHNLLPESASCLGPNGEKLAENIAEEIASLVDTLVQGT